MQRRRGELGCPLCKTFTVCKHLQYTSIYMFDMLFVCILYTTQETKRKIRFLGGQIRRDNGTLNGHGRSNLSTITEQR